MDIKGVTLALLHTIIEQNSQSNSNQIWSQILDHVSWENEQAGTITLESIPENISSAFKKINREIIPEELISDSAKMPSKDFNLQPWANEIATMCLVGSWNENNISDKEIISRIAKIDYNSLILRFREILQIENNPLLYKNGQWSIKERKRYFKLIGPRIFDSTLDIFKECFSEILMFQDPKFDLPIEKRFYTSFENKPNSYSEAIRLGICQGMAIIGNNPNLLSNCSLRKTEIVTIQGIKSVLSNADWKLWATLDRLLPLFAEAAPTQYLNIVESNLQMEKCPFKDLFKQEGNGITGWNFMTGLLWSIETLAWEDEFLIPSTMLLAELHKLDPGGSWGNRPMNSLVSIFLPWYPQTLAAFEKRKIAISSLISELPDVAVKLLTELLPDKTYSADNNYKPQWRNSIPDNWQIKISVNEYWDQIAFYVNLLLGLAKNNSSYSKEIINNLDNLPKESFNALIDFLSSEQILQLSEEEKYYIWSKLNDFIIKHKKYSYTEWALPIEIVSRIESITEILSPSDPVNKYRRLFDSYESEYFNDDKIDWKTQEKIINEKRILALKEILKDRGFEGIDKFIELVIESSYVGRALSFIDDESFDSLLLPNFLNHPSNKKDQFIKSYIWYKFHRKSWTWVDDLSIKNWTTAQISIFYACLPFVKETWQRVQADLASSEFEYWNRLPINISCSGQEINIGINKLLQFGRPYLAIQCLYWSLREKVIIETNTIIKALSLAASSKEPINTLNTHYTVELIKHLQANESTEISDLIGIEWTYLQLLDKHHEAEPMTLEHQLASKPKFFSEIIQLLYKSKKSGTRKKSISEQEKSQALNAYRMLNHWHTPPGKLKDGTFLAEIFLKWLEEVKIICSGSGHLEMALLHVGKVLIYCPPDINGLWINQHVANELNKKESSDMRSGFSTSLFNARGVHIVDPTGKPERELAASYRKKADDLEKIGYFRLAKTLKDLAKSYDYDAERIIEEHRSEIEQDGN